MLFTDARPNVGAGGVRSSVGMARYLGEARVGLTAFGVGLDLGSELVTEVDVATEAGSAAEAICL